MSPCSTPDKPTYQASSGSNVRNPRSMAAVEASITASQPRGEYSPANSANTSPSPRTFQTRCERVRMNQVSGHEAPGLACSTASRS